MGRSQTNLPRSGASCRSIRDRLVRGLPAGAIGLAGEEGSLAIEIGETRNGRGEAGLFHYRQDRFGARIDSSRNPAIPFRKIFRTGLIAGPRRAIRMIENGLTFC